jgi:spermidine synthase
MTAPRFLPLLLGFCMFSTGASGLVNEYVLATITTYILGNSIENFSIVIACMMFMMGVAGFVQNKMSDRHLLQKFIAVEVLMALLGGFAPLAIYAAFGYLEDNFQLVHYFFVLSVGFLIGFEIPLVMRIIDQHNIKLKTNLTIVYAMDYVGAFIGAIIWVKFLLKNYPLTEISFIVAGFNFVVAALTIIYFMNRGIIEKPLRHWLLLIATALALIAGYSQNRDLSQLLEQRFYADPIIYKETTQYQHIVITHNKTLNDTRLYLNGNTQFSSTDEQRYHELLVHPVMAIAPHRARVLILGGGDGLALREINQYTAVQQVTLVDLDPEMIRLASTHPILTQLNQHSFASAKVHTEIFNLHDTGAKQGIYLEESQSKTKKDAQWVAAVDVFNVDADQFLRKTITQPYDVVIIDLPDPSSIELSKLYSLQFYHALKRHLSPHAFIAVQSTSPYHAKPAFLAIGETLKAAGFKVLPYRQNIPSFGDWGFHLAWLGSESIEQVLDRIRSVQNFEVATDFITPQLMAASFVFGKGELESDTPCINTLMKPCLLHHYIDKSWIDE